MILEDEVSIRSFVVINLKRAGYEVVEAGTGEEALELLKANPDVGVAILDIMLPGIDGFEVCRSIRATDKKIGIIMLTARSQEMDKITGLMTGADDYMTKPFSPAELTARIDALYRRIDGDSGSDSVELKLGPFVLNTRNRTLEKDGEIVCYHFYNQNDVEDYLYKNTRFERASRTRYGFGKLYRGEDGSVYMKLNLQIRFKK